MNKLTIGSTIVLFPGAWNEITRDQLLRLSKIFLLNLSENRFLFSALLILMNASIMTRKEEIINGIKHFAVKRGKDRFYLSSIVFYELIHKIKFTIHGSQLTINKIPVVKVGFINYFGPDDCLFNCSFEEFMLADQSFTAFTQTNDKQYLTNLVAIIYRPEDPEYNPINHLHRGDRREPFNDHLIDFRSKKMRKLSMDIQWAVFLFFQGCRNYIVEKFPAPFKPGSGKHQNDGLDYLRLIDNMNGGDPTRNSQIRKLNLYDALTRMQQACEQADRLKTKTV